MENGELLSGGNSNQVSHVGSTVVRNTGAWSPFVHALLQFLHANGFTHAPVFLEHMGNQERLSFIEGDVGHYPLQPFMQSENMVAEAAALLRRFHDTTQHFVVPPGSTFILPLRSAVEYEVICHNDFAPYNLVFKDNHIAGIIDFDTAAPGTRVWDIAYAVYRFAPLAADSHCRAMGWQTPPDRAFRLKLFCDAYGLEDRSTVIDTVIERLEALVAYIRFTSSNLDHLPIYTNDLDYIRGHYAQFCDAVQA